MTSTPLMPYAGRRVEDLLPVLHRHLAAATERHDLGPVPPSLDLAQAVTLLDAYAGQSVAAHVAGAHRQIGYAARELGRAATFYANGNPDLADEFARAAAVYLDQAETTRSYVEQHAADPLDVIDTDVNAISRLIEQTLAPALGVSDPIDPAAKFDTDEHLATIRRALTQLRKACTVNRADVREQLAEAIELLNSAHRDAPAGLAEASGRIVHRIHAAADHVAQAAAALPQATR
ncbi:hypothetical protein ACFWA9_10150 [Kitasatospora sp. NPDC059973]|uniref:hypothetical protein n=1 Tax=Kitasatospora sp. NPDC059973 TaxID=3347020 RepID=UPI0036C4EEE3